MKLDIRLTFKCFPTDNEWKACTCLANSSLSNAINAMNVLKAWSGLAMMQQTRRKNNLLPAAPLLLSVVHQDPIIAIYILAIFSVHTTFAILMCTKTLRSSSEGRLEFKSVSRICVHGLPPVVNSSGVWYVQLSRALYDWAWLDVFLVRGRAHIT